MFGFGTSTKKGTVDEPDMMNHASDILKAASPYLTPDLQRSLNLFVKAFEFMNVLKDVNTPKEKADYFHEQSKIDFEGLLKSIRPHCLNEEGDMIDMFLNMMSAMNFYKTYQEMASMFAASQETNAEYDDAAGSDYYTAEDGDEGETRQHNEHSETSSQGNTEMLSTLLEMLAPEQKGTFEMLKTMMESGILNQMSTQTPGA